MTAIGWRTAGDGYPLQLAHDHAREDGVRS